MSQHSKILNLLETGNWICTSSMYAMFIADPRTRLAELKKLGHNLESRWCENPDHRHVGQMKEWRIQARGLKMDYMVVDEAKGYCCPSMKFFSTHNDFCKNKELTQQTLI